MKQLLFILSLIFLPLIFVEGVEATGGVEPSSSSSMIIQDRGVANTFSDVAEAISYVKASNPGAKDYFGTSVSLSADGTTLAVGAYREDSSARGVGGDGINNDKEGSGAVYVFVKTGDKWTEQAYIKASNTGTWDNFGYSVSLSTAGTTLAVGAYWEDSSARGVGGDGTNNDKEGSGAVYVFVKTGDKWTEQAYIKASNTGAWDFFGYSLSLSAAGTTLAVGAIFENSSARGVGGDGTNNDEENSGAVYVFVRDGDKWGEQAYIKASNTGADDRFGYSVSLSAAGTTLAVGAYLEDSSARGVGGDGTNNDEEDSGAVYVFVRDGDKWIEQAYIKASNTGVGDYFGHSVSLSAAGTTLAVGAYLEDSSARGVGGDGTNNEVGDSNVFSKFGNWAGNLFSGNDQTNNDERDSGAVYVFVRDGDKWTEQAYIKASNTGAWDFFGYSLSLSAAGTTLAVGAYLEDSSARGVGGDGTNNDELDSGAVYVFVRDGDKWTEQAYIKASNTGTWDFFGYSLSLSAAGTTLAVGAYLEDSSARGVGGDGTNNDKKNSGAVYIFR